MRQTMSLSPPPGRAGPRSRASSKPPIARAVWRRTERFAPLPALMAQAEEVVKLTAVCTVCGADAAFHVRLIADGATALQPTAAQVGGAESYQARCRTHRRDAARSGPG